MKKDGLKILLIAVLGIFVAALVYPFLHEMGHIIASVFVGAEVMEMTLFPLPSVLSDVTGVGDMGLVIIGFGGTIFPLLISLLLSRKWFLTWYLRALLQGMSVLALVISIVSVLLAVNPQDDMIQILKFWKYGKTVLLLILCSGTVASLSLIFLDKPGRRICKFFEI